MSILRTHVLENLKTQIFFEDGNLVSDVSEKLGGKNQGPNPHVLLEASLAACTVITLMMYAKRKSIPLVNVDVSIQITSEGEKNEISRTLDFVGALSKEDKAKLLEIADKCPVHKFLTKGATIATNLK
jgi:putative redox protein